MSGRFRRRTGSSVSSAAAISGKAAFLLPLGVTSPRSGGPALDDELVHGRPHHSGGAAGPRPGTARWAPPCARLSPNLATTRRSDTPRGATRRRAPGRSAHERSRPPTPEQIRQAQPPDRRRRRPLARIRPGIRRADAQGGGDKAADGFLAAMQTTTRRAQDDASRSATSAASRMPDFWNRQAENTLDRATAMMPKMLYERLDEIGSDFAVDLSDRRAAPAAHQGRRDAPRRHPRLQHRLGRLFPRTSRTA